jgi:hypothetical protein
LFHFNNIANIYLKARWNDYYFTKGDGWLNERYRTPKGTKVSDSYILLNVRLESGYKYEDGQVVETETVLRNIQIDNGIITTQRLVLKI